MSRIGTMDDGRPVVATSSLKRWWANHRPGVAPEEGIAALITGGLTPVVPPPFELNGSDLVAFATTEPSLYLLGALDGADDLVTLIGARVYHPRQARVPAAGVTVKRPDFPAMPDGLTDDAARDWLRAEIVAAEQGQVAAPPGPLRNIYQTRAADLRRALYRPEYTDGMRAGMLWAAMHLERAALDRELPDLAWMATEIRGAMPPKQSPTMRPKAENGATP